MDAAEDEDKKKLVRRINVDGTQYIADACKAYGCKLLYLSTDYVFNGQGETPWTPDCKDYAELNIYGQGKLDGELAVCVHRSSKSPRPAELSSRSAEIEQWHRPD